MATCQKKGKDESRIRKCDTSQLNSANSSVALMNVKRAGNCKDTLLGHRVWPLVTLMYHETIIAFLALSDRVTTAHHDFIFEAPLMNKIQRHSARKSMVSEKISSGQVKLVVSGSIFETVSMFPLLVPNGSN